MASDVRVLPLSYHRVYFFAKICEHLEFFANLGMIIKRILAYPPAGGGRAVSMYTVYVLYNKAHRKTYIGYTEDLRKRLMQHNEGSFKKSYTLRFPGEWIVIYSEDVDTRVIASMREQELKSFRGRQFISTKIPA